MSLLLTIWRFIWGAATTLLGQRAAAPTQVQAEERAQDQRAAQTADAASARTTIADTAAAQTAAAQETSHVQAAAVARDAAVADQLRKPITLRDDDGFRRD